MSTPAEQLLNQLEAKKALSSQPMSDAERMLSELEAKSGRPDAQVSGFRKDFVDPIARGLSGTADLINTAGAAVTGTLTPRGNSGFGAVTSDLQKLGVLLPEEERSDGLLPRVLEILGGSLVPAGGMFAVGTKIARTVAPTVRNFIQRQLASFAENPKSSAAVELSGILGAGTAGEVLEDAGAGPVAQGVAEVLGGLAAGNLPAAATSIGNNAARLGGSFFRNMNPARRASLPIQSATRDPVAAAARIDPSSPVSPARQTGEEDLIALERRFLEETDPGALRTLEDQSKENILSASKQVQDFGGDAQAARAILTEQTGATVERAVKRAEQAAEEANAALSKLPVNVKTSEIEGAAKGKIDASLRTLNDAEKAAWKKVGFDLEGSYSETETEINGILSSVARSQRSDAIPKRVLDEIAAASTEGQVTTLRDIQGTRSIVRGLKAAAKLDPEKRFQVRFLSKIEDALLRDMESVKGADPEDLKNARNVTADLFAKFKRGKVGDVLGLSDDGVLSFEPGDTLKGIFSGPRPEQGISQLLKGTPDARPEALDFVRRQFILAAAKDGNVNARQASNFISQLREKRVFEALPELEEELTRISSKASRADLLAERARLVKKRGGARIDADSNESIASLFLDRAVGQEADALFDPKVKNAEQLARKVISRFRGNVAAEQGFKSSLAGALVRQTKFVVDEVSGQLVPNGNQLKRLLKEKESLLKAAGFSTEEIDRMNVAVNVIQQEQKAAGRSVGEIMNDPASRLMNVAARVGGAKASALLGTGNAGVGLQQASIASATARDLAKALRTDKAKVILEDVFKNGELMQALLLRNNAPEKVRLQAYAVVRAYLAGIGADIANEPSEDGEP